MNGNIENQNYDRRMHHRYHALQAVATEVGAGNDEHEQETGDAVWDQLNDEQSREVQQHESRFYNGDRYGRDNPLAIAGSMAHETANSAWHAVRETANRAKVVVREWQQTDNNDGIFYNDYNGIARRENNYSESNRSNYDVGEEFDLQFGISDLFRRGEESTVTHEAATKNTNCTMNNNSRTRGTRAEEARQRDNEAEKRPLQGYPFVVLTEGRDVPDRKDYNIHNTNESDRWGIVDNLDVFLTHLYKYYYHRGLTPMLCSFLVETSSLLFTIWLTRLLLIGVDWPKLLTMNCDDETNDNSGVDKEDGNHVCNSHLSDYARIDPLGWAPYILIQGYTFLLLAYALFKTWVFYQDFFGHAIKCRTILHEKLGLSERKLQGGALSWNDVVTKLAEGQESGSYKIINHHNSVVNPFSARANGTRHNKSYSPPHSIEEDTKSQQQEDGTSRSKIPPPTIKPNGKNGNPPAAPPAAAFNLPINPSKLERHHNQSLLDPLQIAQRIMRKENFMLAFWNAGLLECTKVVFPWSGGNDGAQRHYWCGVLEWSFYQCVLNFMFNHKYELRPAFCLDSDSLRRRLKVCGVVHLCLLPFLLVFVILHFVLRHVYDSKMSSAAGGDGGVMGPPRWSSAATWQFREFNELPHAFERRMEPSYKAAVQYCQLFGTSEYVAAIGRLLVFFGGAIGGILFVLGVVVNDTLLLHVQLWGRNLVWYAGIAGITYSIGKALEPTKEAAPSVTRNLFEDMDNALNNVSKHTHYHPEYWKGRGWDSNVYSSFKTMFDSEVKLFVHELSALVLTPYILYFCLSEKAADICEFCILSKSKLVLLPSSSTENGSGGIIAGDVCGFSTFDFDTYGDEEWEGRTLGKSAMLQRQREDPVLVVGGEESLTESILRTGNLEDATRLHPKPRTRHGKMEKSFFTFKAAHPDWNACFPPSGERVEEYRSSAEKAMMARERELHVQAAKRDVETLARIEEEQKSQNKNQAQRTAFQTNIRWNDEHHVSGLAKTPRVNEATGSQSGLPSYPSRLSASKVERNDKECQPPQWQPPPPTLPSSIQNALQPYVENLSTHIGNIPSSLPSPIDNPAVNNSAPDISFPKSLSNPTSSEIHQRQDSRQTPNSDTIHTQPEKPFFAPVDSSSRDSSPFPSPSGVSVLSNPDVPQSQLLTSQSGLTVSSIRLLSSLSKDHRGSQRSNRWLQRFQEGLDEQEQEVQQNQRQQQSSSQGEPFLLERKSNSADGGSSAELAPSDAQHSDAQHSDAQHSDSQYITAILQPGSHNTVHSVVLSSQSAEPDSNREEGDDSSPSG